TPRGGSYAGPPERSRNRAAIPAGMAVADHTAAERAVASEPSRLRCGGAQYGAFVVRTRRHLQAEHTGRYRVVGIQPSLGRAYRAGGRTAGASGTRRGGVGATLAACVSWPRCIPLPPVRS